MTNQINIDGTKNLFLIAHTTYGHLLLWRRYIIQQNLIFVFIGKNLIVSFISCNDQSTHNTETAPRLLTRPTYPQGGDEQNDSPCRHHDDGQAICQVGGVEAPHGQRLHQGHYFLVHVGDVSKHHGPGHDQHDGEELEN